MLNPSSKNCLTCLSLLVANWAGSSIGTGAELLRPTTIEWLNAEQLCVLNQSGVSVSLIDRRSNLVSELKISPARDSNISAKLSDMSVVDTSHLAVLDSSHGELWVVRISDGAAQVIGSVDVGHSPIDVIVEGRNAFVSNLWSRRWTVVSLENFYAPQVVGFVDLSFSPRHQILLNDRTVFMTDAFGGNWATVDVFSQKVLHTGEFVGSHNITGITVDQSGENLLIPHMTLNPEKPTTKFNVHWGDVVLNVVRRVNVGELLGGGEISENLYYLGRPDIAAGDPTGIAVTESNQHIVCFSGTAELGISDVGANSFDRVKVGCRPIDFAISPDGELIYVANQLDDSVSVVRIDGRKPIATIRLAEQVTAHSPAQLGERLFFDAKLSSDGWLSCHSCHTDGHTNGGRADTFGDGFEGDAKRVPTLLGVHESGPWAWNGEIADLASQIRKSVTTTMRGPALEDDHVASLTEYVGSLTAPPSVRLARGELDTNRHNRGRELFDTFGCDQCHVPESYTSSGSYHVGFRDQSGSDKFNPPSLRAVSHRPSLLHDNRASSVRDVLERLRHQIDSEISEQDLRDLVYFVESL